MENVRILILSLIIVLHWCSTLAGKAGNEVPEREERKFRNGKVQQVWEKANRVKLSPVKLSDLFGDLKHHDQLMMEFKYSRKEGDDNDGLREAELTEGLHEIMDKYGLAGKKSSTWKKNSGGRFEEDPKLEKLWKTANKHGKFTENELEALHLEFTHHRRKVEEYEILRSEASDFEELSDNAVEKQLAQEENNDKKQIISELHSDIQEGYERLELKTKQGTLSSHSVPFTEPRVAQLWEDAKQGNFSERELESIKEELQHFQSRVQKHNFFRDQLKNSVEKMQFNGDEENVPKKHVETHSHLQNKVQDLAAKVKKLHHQLTEKLSSRREHKEL